MSRTHRIAALVSNRLGEKSQPLQTEEDLEVAAREIQSTGDPNLYYHPRKRSAWWVIKDQNTDRAHRKTHGNWGQGEITRVLGSVTGIDTVRLMTAPPPKGVGWIQVLPEHTKW